MRMTIEISEQAAEYLRKQAAELGPPTRPETIAARLVEQSVAGLPMLSDDDLALARLTIEQDGDTWTVHHGPDKVIRLASRADAARAGLQLLAGLVRMYRAREQQGG